MIDDKGLPVQLYELSTDLGEEDQQSSLRALKARGLIVAGTRGPFLDSVTNVSGEAYTLSGLHPIGDDLKERFVSVLEQLAEKTTDTEEASKLSQAAKQFGALSRDTISGIAAALISAQLGG